MDYPNDTSVDIVEFEKNKYALINPDSISFISDIKDGDIEQILEQEETNYNQSIYQSIEEKYFSIVFLPTLDCNLRCSYCYSCGGDRKQMLSNDIAIQAINNLVINISDAKTYTLYLHFLGGGEPFLNFSCMKSVLEYSKKVFNKVIVTVVTNGTFGAKELEWIINNNVGVRISFDGIFHEEQRPFASGKSSRKIVERNIINLVELSIPFKIKLTITNESVLYVYESVKYISSLGAKEIHIKPVHYSGNSRTGKRLVPDAKVFAENISKTLNKIIEEKIEVKLVNSFDIKPSTGYYCRSCAGKALTITPEGDISACVEIAHRNEKYSDLFFLGNTINEFNIDPDKLHLFRKLHYMNYVKCKNCNIKKLCLGGCPLEAVWDSNDLFTPSEYRCKLNSILYPQLLKAVYYNNDILGIVSENFQKGGV
jgi:uncharacterized protein